MIFVFQSSAPVRVHGSVHDYLKRACLQNVNVFAISISPTLKSPNAFKGFTGRISKISNETKGVHGFTGPAPQSTPRLCPPLQYSDTPPLRSIPGSSALDLRLSTFDLL